VSKLLENSKGRPRLVHVEVKNFGPITEASIDLESVTVFTGPYNTGKTYLATLVYILDKIINYVVQDIRVDQVLRRKKIYGDFTGEKIREILRPHLDDVKTETMTAWKKGFPQILLREFSGNFAIISPSDLVTHGSDFTYVKAVSKFEDKPSFEIEFEIRRSTGEIHVKVLTIEDQLVNNFIEKIVDMSVRPTGGSMSFKGLMQSNPLYIPAERLFALSNIHSLLQLIIETHGARAFGPGIAERFALQRIKGMMRPLLLTYLTYLIRVLKEGNPFERIQPEKSVITSKDVSSVIGGDVRFDKETLTVFYKHKGGHEVPLAGASSGVAQLVSLLLSLPIERSVLQNIPLVVIEEPEINLHANHQLEVASLLARFSGYTNLIVTTHSEYMLEKFAHLWAEDKIPSFGAYFIDPDSHKAFRIGAKRETGEIELIRTINEAVEALAGEALKLLGQSKK